MALEEKAAKIRKQEKTPTISPQHAFPHLCREQDAQQDWEHA